MASDESPPFEFTHQLTLELHGPSRHVPGHPHVPLFDRRKVWDLLVNEFCSELDSIASHLWWMSKQDSGSISPLHRQRVKRRTIVVTEDPKLHLVWIHDRIFIKPLPRYIGSYTFWRDYLCIEAGSEGRGPPTRRAALGFLRTYYHLIKHESDLRIAQDPSLGLIPAAITWEQFCNFTSSLAGIADEKVSPRYAYGEIRLTRLNFYAPILLGKSHFQKVDYQYAEYFARLYAPFLFVLAVVSVILSGLQIVASVGNDAGSSWTMGMSLWISVAFIVASCGLLFTFGFLVVYKVAKEWKYAIRDHLRLLEEKRGV
ncbi:uncharacterized protein N7443_005385 [Penicillium atrosanguineum]|uniref:uncharacterized protein n=1 Tax=Penicillium atrosanguineum TaxID=1132637 RepID=UPI0023A43D76|nr:uncharacterized protein N7443_005385 [Penicillium atrosanguineum]KAJ5300383.1 hypothetical protein N7443_005385 [Penicillium atrosanguineum]